MSEYSPYLPVAFQTVLLLLGGYAMVIRNDKDSKFLKDQIAGIQLEIRDLAGVVIQQAIQTTRLDGLNERFNLLDKRVEDMRHLQGFIVHDNRKGGIEVE